ncbi:kinase-like protein [Linderina pennispora]|uniref:non-specific serine/threonine protein kinase n=1 Tax=Linderina pennispora TaxID=61395 RepID=A0A1Y1W0B9_9FUNG|nr:kinase-like protein [Linderina pennispora]ORX66942.1 kinase-like protein [Linderina pennispora]
MTPLSRPVKDGESIERVRALSGQAGPSGQRLGAITLSDQVLGYGSHGTVVYRGEFQGRAVAVKRLLLDFYDVADHEVQVLQESDTHPNVIRYFCTERHDHFMYIALELCCGSLADAVMQAPKAALAQQLLAAIPRKQVLHQLARGLYHLHALKLVHRDIKPQNILIAPPPHRRRRAAAGPAFADSNIVAGGTPRVLISDFGLSRILDDDESSFANTFTMRGIGGGTVGWRAPECFDSPDARNAAINGTTDSTGTNHTSTTDRGLLVGGSRRRMTRAVDIFSMGCVFHYVLMDGEHPFGDRLSREQRILAGRPDLRALQASSIPSAIEAADLIAHMVARDERSRPSAASVLVHPYFWDAAQRLAFLQDVSDCLEAEARLIKAARESAMAEAVDGGVPARPVFWDRRLDTHLRRDLGKFRKYDATRLRDLLRIIRNKKNHYQDMPEPLRLALGDIPDGYLAYFESRFPYLLLHCYYFVLEDDSLRTATIFRPYFRAPAL